jgi:hypothetical protein
MLLLLDIASMRIVGKLAQLPFFRRSQISGLPKRLRQRAANCGIRKLEVALKARCVRHLRATGKQVSPVAQGSAY